MPLLRHAFALLLLAAPITLGVACDAESVPAESEAIRTIDYELFPSTRKLEADDVAAITDVSADGQLRFAKVTKALEGLEAGQVILAGVSPTTPAGLLRVVLAVEEDESGGLLLRTAAAPLQLAFRKLHARVADTASPFVDGTTFTPSGANAISGKALALGGDLGDHQNYQVVVFDGDDDLDTKNDQVVIDAALGGGFEFDLSIDVDWGAVDKVPQVVIECATSPLDIITDGELPKCSIEELMPELKLTFEVDPYLDAEVKVGGAATVGFSEDFEIGSISLPPITLGPLVFLPSADIVATIEGSASARFSAQAHANIKVSSKVVLSSKAKNSEIVPFAVKEVDADAETPEIDLYAEARVKAGVRFTLALYGVVGPYAMASAYAVLHANPIEEPCWDFGVGLEAQLGVIVKASLPYVGSFTFLDWNTGPISIFEKTVATGDCKVTEEGERVPPGGGPTATILQKPPFTPWARLLSAPVDGGDLASVLAYPTGFPFIAKSIDGRFVAGGGGALGLLKLDAEGDTTWTTQLVTPADQSLRSLGSVASADAGLVSLYRPGDTSAFVLAKQTQAGALVKALTFRLPDECGAKAQGILRDAQDGFVVVGECPFLRSAWLVHLDRNLTVTRSTTLRDENADTIRLTPTALTRSEGQLIVVGDLVRTAEPAGSLAFVLRLDDEERPQQASSFACPTRLSLYPSAVIPSVAGNLTLVGDASGIGYVARIKPDGTLGFVRFPNLGGGIASGFAPNAVVELPTTGLVVAATVDAVGDAGTDLILVGLDGDGHPLWGREYMLQGAAFVRNVGWPSAYLTDDGGILVSATAGVDGSSSGDLLGMKVYARDGTLPDGPLVSSVEILPQEDEYAVEDRAFSALSEAILVEVSDFAGMPRRVP